MSIVVGEGLRVPHTDPQPPTLLFSQSRPAAEGSRSQAPWAGGGQRLSSLLPWRPVSPRASCLACTCSPSSSPPTPLSLTRWGPGDEVDSYEPRVASFQISLWETVLGMEPRALYMLNMHTTTKPDVNPSCNRFCFTVNK